MNRDDIVAVLDVGSSCVRALIGMMENSGRASILGLGHAPCTGVEQGAVIDIGATEEAIRSAIRDAESMAGLRATGVYLGTGGVHISGRVSQGSTAIKNQEVDMDDVEEVINAAKAMAFPRDEVLLHALPQHFSVDRQHKVRRPLGMAGERLEVRAYLISGLSNLVHNLQKCAARCELRVERIVVEQIADSYAVLQQDEREAGVCVVNIGAGSTKMAVFRDGVPIFIGTGVMGGNHVTNDLAVALRIPNRLAEEQKRRYGCAVVQQVPAEHSVRVVRIDKHDKQSISAQALAGFIQPRYEEIITAVDEQLTREKIKDRITAGLVLVGGAARIEGLEALASEIMHLAVRTGQPLNVKDEDIIKGNLQWTTAVGLLLYGLEERMHSRSNDGFFINHPLSGKWNWFDKLSHWIEKNF